MLTILTILAGIPILYAFFYGLEGERTYIKETKHSTLSRVYYYVFLITQLLILSLLMVFTVSLYGVIPHTTKTTYGHVDGKVYKMHQGYNMYGEGILLTPTEKDGRTVVKTNGKYKYIGD